MDQKQTDTHRGWERGGVVSCPPPWPWPSCCILDIHLRCHRGGGGSMDRNTRAGQAHPRPCLQQPGRPSSLRRGIDAKQSSAGVTGEDWEGLGFVPACEMLRLLPHSTTCCRNRDMTRPQGLAAPLEILSYPTANRSKEEGRKHLLPLRDLARGKKEDTVPRWILKAGSAGKTQDLVRGGAIHISHWQRVPNRRQNGRHEAHARQSHCWRPPREGHRTSTQGPLSGRLADTDCIGPAVLAWPSFGSRTPHLLRLHGGVSMPGGTICVS
jgi:hypothetical protein